MSGPPDLIALAMAKRERWVPLDDQGHEVLVRMPSVFEALRWKIGTRADAAESFEATAKGAVRDWRGFKKMDLHGDSADPLPFNASVWAALVDYQSDWARQVFLVAVDMLTQHQQATEAAEGN